MQWLSSIQEAATSAVTSLQETIENEKKEFLQEYNSTGTAEAASSSKAGPSPSTAATAASANDADALQHLRRVGWAMLNPLADQDSLKEEERGPSVVMLPWEAPGLSEPVRGPA